VLQIVSIHYDIRNDALLEAILARSNVVINLLGERPASPRPPSAAPLPAARMASRGRPCLGAPLASPHLWLACAGKPHETRHFRFQDLNVDFPTRLAQVRPGPPLLPPLLALPLSPAPATPDTFLPAPWGCGGS
jgi:hypothetical protein